MATPGALRPCYGRVLSSSPSLTSPLRPPHHPRAVAAAAAASFSTSAPLCRRKRKNKDMNPSRGVSSIYRSGPREPLSMSNIPLPRPRDFKPKLKVDETHGLWGFFPNPGQLMYTPEETEKHGRAWSVEELRRKSWEDLHALWWTCCRERNMLSTSMHELERSELGFGKRELEVRDDEVRKTMGAIKHALTERFYTWEDATDVARNDPEINMDGGDGEAYNPSTYEEEYEAADTWGEQTKEAPKAEQEAAAAAAAAGGAKVESKPEKQTT